MMRNGNGFTLLEVLAAVAILGIAFVVLVQNNAESVMSEGENARRIEASLLADRVLFGLENDLDRGLLPPVGAHLEEEGLFEIETDVKEWSLVLPDPTLESAVASSGATLLGPENSPDNALRRIDVTVRWDEGGSGRLRHVSRTTFAFDPAGAQAALEQLLEQAASGAGGAGGEGQRNSTPNGLSSPQTAPGAGSTP